MAVIEEFVPNEGDGWRYVVDALAHGLEDALAAATDNGSSEPVPRGGTAEPWDLEPARALVGPHIEWASLLGRRTAELHVALVSAPDNPDFVPQPLTQQERIGLFHGARSLARQVLRDVADNGPSSEAVDEVLQRQEEIVERLRRVGVRPRRGLPDPLPR